MGNAASIDVCFTQAIQRLAFGYFDYAVLPGAVMFGWVGIGPSLATVFAVGGSSAFNLAILGLAVGQVVNRGLKVFFQRARPLAPEQVARSVKVKVPCMKDPDGASFPSGDTMAASAVGAALYASFASSENVWLWLLLGVYAGFARIFFWCHFVSDCICGYAVGTLSTLAIASVTQHGQSIGLWHVGLAVPPFVIIMKALGRLQHLHFEKR